MTGNELLKYQLALDQQNFRDDLQAMQTHSDERLDEVKRDIRTTLWSGLAVAQRDRLSASRVAISRRHPDHKQTYAMA